MVHPSVRILVGDFPRVTASNSLGASPADQYDVTFEDSGQWKTEIKVLRTEVRPQIESLDSTE